MRMCSRTSSPHKQSLLGKHLQGLRGASAIHGWMEWIGVHNSAVKFLTRATDENQTFEGADANVLRATRLMRLFKEQLETLASLRGKTSEQKVTVEHVHVYEGGQAIVGSVAHPGGGGKWKFR